MQVTVFSTSEKKKAEALKTLGADHFIVSKDKEQMEVRSSMLVVPSSDYQSCLVMFMPCLAVASVHWQMSLAGFTSRV